MKIVQLIVLLFLVVMPTKGQTQKHQYVDLGLPSGTLWATTNIGASSPEKVGYYFAWGETKKKTLYSENNYFDPKATKYNNSNNVLNSSDDAANVLWGRGWSIPSHDEWMELGDERYTTCKLTKRNGKTGMLVTSRSNKKSIFIPVGGHHSDNRGDRLKNPDFGEYWCNELYSDYNAKIIFFNQTWMWKDRAEKDGIQRTIRENGHPIRPVYHRNVSSNLGTPYKLIEAKHYKISKDILTKTTVMDMEADICIAENVVMLVLGDGNGHKDDFIMLETVKTCSKDGNCYKYTLEGNAGTIITYKKDNLLYIEVREPKRTNIYVASPTPYDHPTLSN